MEVVFAEETDYVKLFTPSVLSLLGGHDEQLPPPSPL